jgi:hypothetical protein
LKARLVAPPVSPRWSSHPACKPHGAALKHRVERRQRHPRDFHVRAPTLCASGLKIMRRRVGRQASPHAKHHAKASEGDKFVAKGSCVEYLFLFCFKFCVGQNACIPQSSKTL